MSEIYLQTNPLQVGILFDSYWNQSSHHSTLRISLFEYYLENGWTKPCNHKYFVHHDCNSLESNSKKSPKNNDDNYHINNPILKQVMLGAAVRGDIVGMSYLFNHHHHHHQYHLFYHNFKHDTDLCTMAGAAGQLEALKWLLFVQNCKWDPEEVYREASENIHNDVMLFVEQCCFRKDFDGDSFNGIALNIRKSAKRMDVRMPYGEGMPW